MALNKFGIEKRNIIHDKLVPDTLRALVVTVCSFLAEGEKKNLQDELYEATLAADEEYGKCREIIALDQLVAERAEVAFLTEFWPAEGVPTNSGVVDQFADLDPFDIPPT